MWRYVFVNLCFFALLIGVFAHQHSHVVFAPPSEMAAAESDSPAAGFAKAAHLVKDFWRRGVLVKEWLMEYKLAQWEILSTRGPAETDLLEARFHVANAEVFTAVMGENDRAIKALARAETAVEAVQSLVQPKLIPRLAAVRDEILAAEAEKKSSSIASTAPFEAIKTDLDRLITIVRSSARSVQSNPDISIQG
jgi:hypothetical protein